MFRLARDGDVRILGMQWTLTLSPMYSQTPMLSPVYLGGSLTTVTWTLAEVESGTKLTLTHEGISAAAGEAAMNILVALDAGWDQHISELRSAVV